MQKSHETRYVGMVDLSCRQLNKSDIPSVQCLPKDKFPEERFPGLIFNMLNTFLFRLVKYIYLSIWIISLKAAYI